MRRLRIVVVCLAAACACGAIAASSASAALPELGRCVKLATKTGAFRGAGCVALNTKHTGEYEFESGPGANKAFKLIFPGMTLENTSAHKLLCTNGQLTGEFTGAKSLKISKVLLEGCEDATHHTSCYTNPVNPAVIESENALVGELGSVPGSINPANPFAAWDLKSESSLMPILLFFCGEARGMITFMLEGSVIGRVTKTNVMVSSFTFTYKQKEGKQAFTAFIGGEEDVLKLSEKLFGSTETFTIQAGLAGTAPSTDGEPLEIKARV